MEERLRFVARLLEGDGMAIRGRHGDGMATARVIIDGEVKKEAIAMAEAACCPFRGH